MTNKFHNHALGVALASLLSCGSTSCASDVKFDWPGSKNGTCYPTIEEYVTAEYPWTESEPDENIITKEAATETGYIWIIDKSTSINASVTLMRKSKHEACIVLSAIHASSIDGEFGPHGSPPATITTFSTAPPGFRATKVTYTLDSRFSRYFPTKCEEILKNRQLKQVNCASAFGN